MGIPAQPVKPNYHRTFPQVHSYVTKVNVLRTKVDSYGIHMDYNRDLQVYDNFKLNAHVHPLDALSSQTISQAVLGYFHCLFSKN